ncbi:MAG: hypothetical protein ACI4N3_03095, partial [Alphaproteobacteria bacterium]
GVKRVLDWEWFDIRTMTVKKCLMPKDIRLFAGKSETCQGGVKFGGCCSKTTDAWQKGENQYFYISSNAFNPSSMYTIWPDYMHGFKDKVIAVCDKSTGAITYKYQRYDLDKKEFFDSND